MSKVYGLAIIGCGQMGAAHMDNIYYKENVEVKCTCDTDPQSAMIFKKKYNALRAETDAQKCISSEDVDIVIIATYPSSHLELLKLCMKYKKHVICEKPITTNLEEGREFLQLVKSNPDVKVLIGHILRHNNTYITVADMIKNGAIGHPVVMRMVQNHHTMKWNRYLKLIEETSPIIDCGVHYIDVMQWFTGAKVTHVSGVGAKIEEDVPDGKYNYGIINARLSDGSIGYYEAGWSNTIASDNLKEFVGPKGRIKIVFSKDRQTHQEEGDLVEYYKFPEKTYEIINVEGKRKPTDSQFDCLIDMIEKGAEANPTIDEVFDSFRIALEADEVIREKIKEDKQENEK